MNQQLNIKKYPVSSRWQSMAACRNTDPNLFVSFKDREEAKKLCDRCLVSERCSQEPSYVAQYHDYSLVGIWGGVWHPSTYPEPQHAYKKLLDRMRLEADNNGIWQGNPKKQPALSGMSDEETRRTARYLIDHGLISEIEPSKWKIGNVFSSVSEIWMHACQIADRNGRFVLDIPSTQIGSGMQSSNQVRRGITALVDQGFIVRENPNNYKIDMEKAGAI